MVTSDADLWKIFANKLKSTFTVGQDIGPKNRIYIPLLNSTTIPAGNNVASAITNYGVLRAGDSLINLDNPMYVPSSDSYAMRCLMYLRNVQLSTDSSVGTADVLSEKKAAASRAEEEFQQIKENLRKKWKDSGEEKEKSFGDWANENSSRYTTARAAMEQTAAAYYSVLTRANGPGGQNLMNAIKNLEDATGQGQSIHNMVVSSAQVSDNAAEGLPYERAPKYVIDATYTRTLQNWMSTVLDAGVENGVTISFDSNESNQYNWESLGHSTDKVNANARFFPFFRVEYAYGNEKKSQEIRASEIKSTVHFELVANGIRAFSIQPYSSWNPGDVQSLYPKLLPHSAEVLKQPMVQISNIVVGWKVAFKIKMDKELYDKVTGYMEEATKHDANASATIFGFRINVGGKSSHDEENSTNWSNVDKKKDAYEMVIPASTDNAPVLLAAFGRVLGSK